MRVPARRPIRAATSGALVRGIGLPHSRVAPMPGMSRQDPGRCRQGTGVDLNRR